MSELINEKDVLIALGKGKSVQYKYNEPHKSEWLDLQPSGWCLTDFLEEDFLGKYLFRLKPRTITINGIEVPAPFDSSLKHKQYAYALNTVSPDGYSSMKFYEGGNQPLICWTDEEEIKQVVAALRSVFGKK